MTTSDALFHFVIVPKVTNQPFFDECGEGCKSRAGQLDNIQCHYIGHDSVDAVEQARIIKELVTHPTKYNLTQVPDGISIAVIDENITGEAINYVYDSGIAVTTWDADAPLSKRQSFIGTDNYRLGVNLGQTLNKLNPNGTYYGMITGVSPNLKSREDGVRFRLEGDYKYPTKWKQVSYSPLNCEGNVTLAIQQMYQYAADPNIKAIISVGGWPMVDTQSWKDFVDANRHVFTIVSDSSPGQIELMQQGYVNGLVGQMPFQMGVFSAEQLLRINQGYNPIMKQVIVTPLLDVSRIPDDLPILKVDNNYIANLAILAYVFCAIVTLSSISISAWVWWNRTNSVIRASQPPFLYMICAGTFIMGLSLIPLTFDDEHGKYNIDIACMAFPWLFFIGSSSSFAALVSKTWRIHTIMKHAKKFRRVKVTVKDFLLPYIILITLNVVILLCWTFIDPMTYIRKPSPGTDDWGRVLSTHGFCGYDHDSAALYGILLVILNGIVLIIANVFAFKARKIKTQYNESRYIAMIMSSLLQIYVIGVPILYLIRQDPRSSFILTSCLVFLTCMDILGFLFGPKAFHKMKEDKKTVRESTVTDSRTSVGLKFKMVAPEVKSCVKKMEGISLDKIPLLEEFLSILPELNEDEEEKFVKFFERTKINKG